MEADIGRAEVAANAISNVCFLRFILSPNLWFEISNPSAVRTQFM